MTYLGPAARDSYARYQTMYSSLSSARNYDVRENPGLFNEAMRLLEGYGDTIYVPDGYPTAMGQSVRDLFRARNAMSDHFRKDRELGLEDIRRREANRVRVEQQRAEMERFRKEAQALHEMEEERRRKEKREKEEKETKRFYELKGTIDDTDRRLTANINQLREDFFGAMKKQGDLFSELSSVREKDNADTIAQFNEALMESSNMNISLQSDVDKLNKKTENHNKNLKALRKEFARLSDLYSVSARELKLNESRINEHKNKTEQSLTDIQNIQKKLDDNSAMFANEKEELVREIEAIKKNTSNTSRDARHEFDILNSKLETLTKNHDAVKTDLLNRLKKQQGNNLTRFEELNAQNRVLGKLYDHDIRQLRRDLDVTRDEAMQAKDALQEQEQLHRKQEKVNKARFKVLYDYQANTDRQIKIQEKKTTNFAQLKRTRVMPDKAKALRNFRRGRYALLDEFA